ncbi:MAG: HAD family hydrolase [Clostridia bacterium]|nr:HAD family hydrolase [Clostridia bacterium]
MDGTLLDTLDDLTDSVNNALGTFGFPLREKDEIRLFLGNGIKNLVERAVPAGTEEETVRQVLDCFRTHYFAHSADKTKAYDGVLPLLEELKRKGIKTAVVSNKADKAVKELAKTYFGDLLDVAVRENEEAGVRKKPAPDEVFAAMRSLGVRREECLFVGDSEVDAETAAAAGIKGIACLWGFRDRGFLTEKGVSRFIDTPAELYAYLK